MKDEEKVASEKKKFDTNEEEPLIKENSDVIYRDIKPLSREEKKKEDPKSSKRSIPQRALKSIIIAILLVTVGIICSVLFSLSYKPPFNTIGNYRYYLLSVGVLTIPAGTYTLYLAYKCYIGADNYRWSILFL